MNRKLIGVMSALCLLFTIAWLMFLIVGMSNAGPLDTFEQVMAHVRSLDVIFYLTYINAGLVTISAIMLYALLYLYLKPNSEQWALVGLVFVPVYGLLALLAYLSQITIVPNLLRYCGENQCDAVTVALLRESIQMWSRSSMHIINNLAYAVLGVPSIVFGVLMYRKSKWEKVGGVLFALDGIACIFGFGGIAANSQLLSQGSLVGGILFLFALFPLTWHFLSVKSELN